MESIKEEDQDEFKSALMNVDNDCNPDEGCIKEENTDSDNSWDIIDSQDTKNGLKLKKVDLDSS